jgi:DNA primase
MDDWVSFSEVKSRVSLERLLRCYSVDWLRRSGTRQYRGRCPIHQGEGKEAFHANYERNVFHCFACGAGGNVLDFVAAMEKCTIRQAAIQLQRRFGGIAAIQSTKSKLVTKKRGINPPLNFSLTVDSRHPYLAQREVRFETADYFGVGYFGRAGLMSHRIAIPIHDCDGRLVAYCGRSLNGAEPRYQFPSGFRKSHVVYNYHRAFATGARQLIVVEGFVDCMRVHQAGFPNIAALMGAQLSPTQKDLLTSRFQQIVLMLDGDETGRAAMTRIARDLSSACLVIQVRLPANVQPDQMTADQIRHALTYEERRQQP